MSKCEDLPTRAPLPAGARLLVETAYGSIAIFGVGGNVHAIEDGCLRCGNSLVTGPLEGTSVTCRVCGWGYDVTSGCVVGVPALRVASYRIGAYASAATTTEADRRAATA